MNTPPCQLYPSSPQFYVCNLKCEQMEESLTSWVALAVCSLLPSRLSTSRLSPCICPEETHIYSVLHSQDIFHPATEGPPVYLQVGFSSDLVLEHAVRPLQDVDSRLTHVDPQGCGLSKDIIRAIHPIFLTKADLFRLIGCFGNRS